MVLADRVVRVAARCTGHEPTKRLVRPAHQMPPAKWHLSPNLDAKGPLSKEQVKTFFEDGARRVHPCVCVRCVRHGDSCFLRAQVISSCRSGTRKQPSMRCAWTSSR